MFSIDGMVEYGLKINGVDIPIGPSTISGMSIIQNKSQTVPVAQIGFTDMFGLKEKGLLTDGAKIEISLNPQYPGETPKPNNFRLFNVLGATPSPQGTMISLSAYLDAPKMMSQINTKNHNGTSYEALQFLAKELGIPFEGDVTNDKMNWLPSNLPFGDHMFKIAKHAWSSADTAMQMVYSSLGNGEWGIKFKDLAKQLKTPPKLTFTTEGFNKHDEYSIEGVINSNHGGYANNTAGYGGSVIQSSLKNLNGSLSDIFDAISFITSVTNLNQASDIKGMLDKTRRIIAPPNTGNTHDKYEEAGNQNARFKSTLSNQIDIVTPRWCDLGLLDMIQVNQYTPEGKYDSINSGLYMISSRVQHVASVFYRERLTAVRQGSN